MKNILYLLLLTSLSGFSQILSINDAADPESEFSLQELVENILISGDCAEVNNFTEQVSGSETQIQTKSYGYFTRPAGSSFPFEEGIIITSGRAFPAGNASNIADPYPSFDNNLPGDTDLETALNINATEDATFVKFNFVPTTPELSFRFIMASEEYNGNFECTYSDSFAFLLREVGTTTYTNLAVLPDGTPVSVTNINRASGCAANVNYFEGYNLPHTNYGGQTTAITATATVTPNQTYEIKLVVSDQGDPSYDSAIFLEAGGFNIGLDLGQDQTVSGGNPACSNETLVLNTQIPATTSPHTWFLDGVELVGENNATLNVTTAGIYSVSVDLGTTCSATDSIEIEFQTPPVANSIPNQLACDDMTNDGFENFDLLALNSFILGSQSASDFTVSYHKNLTDAESGANPLGDNYTNQTANQIETLVARIEDNTYGCFNTTSFSIDVFQRPIISDYLYNLCDDGADGDNVDGFTEFDLNSVNSQILGTQNPSQFHISYHLTQDDADNNASPLPLLYTNETIDTQDIIVRLENVDYDSCYSTSTVTLHVLSIYLEEKYVICLDSSNTVIDPITTTYLPNPPIETHYSNAEYTFQWYTGEAILASNIIPGATQSFYYPTTPGYYTVNATDVISGCTIPATTLVVSSYPPEQISVEVITNAFTDNNSLEVSIQGIGNYQINLDHGVWQSSTTFQHVTGGEHVIRVRDLYNCNELLYKITVMDYPKVFTPNGDGYNDTWNIYNIETQLDAKIYIYDKYGKLLKQLIPGRTGWDGTFNGNPLRTDDYWFTVKYTEPLDQVRKEFKAHFTLKR